MEMNASIQLFMPMEIKEALKSKTKSQGLFLSHGVRALILGYINGRLTPHQEDVFETRDKWHKVTRNIRSGHGRK
jgi:hypothetical protein